MSEFKRYRRKQIAELRPVTQDDINGWPGSYGISLSDVDRAAGSPKLGDMIARNPKNHDDQWLITATYFNDNFEPIE